MGCNQYQDQLMDAALGGLPPEREAALHAHLRECASCRSEFDRQQRLCAAMDQALEAGVAAEPSPEFLARIRTKIAEQPAPGREWLGGWLPVAAGAVAVVALLVVWFFSREAVQPAPQVSPVAEVAPRPKPAERPATMPPQVAVRRARPSARPSLLAASAKRADLPEVLVPEDQQAGVRWLYQAMHRHPATVIGILAEVAAQTDAASAPIQVEELKIKPMEIAPIQAAEKDGQK